jgi:hypothetical protein
MSKHPKVCYERVLPSSHRAPLPPLRRSGPGGRPTRAAIVIEKRWPLGSELRVRYIGGTAEQRRTVEKFAAEWFEFANLSIAFSNTADAEIRIAFADDGAWSYIGTDCLGIPRDQPTMNFGWLDQGVVLHEFGHALGLIHEHQNPTAGIQWNREKVIEALSGPPNFWDPDTIEHNMFAKYSTDIVNGTALDPKSIMLYSFPAEWTVDGFHTAPNEALSEVDKSFVASEAGYAGRGSGGGDDLVELTVGNLPVVEASIERPGQEGLFRFTADEAGRYRVETEGRTDVIMSLFGPDNRTRLVAEDDDGGSNRNARVDADLQKGTYYVKVRHFNPQNGTGAYTIHVSR